MHRLGLRIGRRPVVWLTIAWIGLSPPLDAAIPKRQRLAPRDRIQPDYTAPAAPMSADLTALAEFCDEQDFAADADYVRLLAAPFSQQTLDVDALPDHKQPPLPGTLPPAELSWRTKLRSLQVQY